MLWLIKLIRSMASSVEVAGMRAQRKETFTVIIVSLAETLFVAGSVHGMLMIVCVQCMSATVVWGCKMRKLCAPDAGVQTGILDASNAVRSGRDWILGLAVSVRGAMDCTLQREKEPH